MENFALFKRHVDAIHSGIKMVIEGRGSRADWPTLISKDAGDEGVKVVFCEPAILWDAPIRGSTSASLDKRAIVMDGSFYFKNGTFDKGSACLEVYRVVRPQGKGQCELELLEAMHFDIEPHALQSPFHPMFHAQFGKNNRWDLSDLRDRIARLARIDGGKVVINRDLMIPSRDVRIPTPQMDYLSMLVMVVADYFCEKNSTHAVRTGFRSLLKKVMDSKNVARSGRQSIQLEKRWNSQGGQPFCASHWYEESCN